MTNVEAIAGLATADGVLIVAPFRRDANVLETMLRESGIPATVCADPGTLEDELASGCGAVLLTQEGLTAPVFEVLRSWLEVQPHWSELPIILLSAGRFEGASIQALQAELPAAKLTVLQRPVHRMELETAVRAAVVARRRQVRIRDQLEWQAEMQRELNHRVKNILANVTAIFHMSLRQSASLKAFAASFGPRLNALSKVHGALATPGAPRTLTEIAEVVLSPYRSSVQERVRINGPPLRLTSTAAITLALCLHELATNAGKYGALSGEGGRVSLEWSLEGSPTEVRILWREEGGPATAPPTHTGFGTHFITSAARTAFHGSADFTYPIEGLVCALTVPIDKIADPEAEPE